MDEIKTLNFFGENGITSTSANHVANLAKEMVRSYQEKLAAVTFYDETIGLIGNREQTKIHSGLDIASLLSLPKILDTISQAHSLIAFFREAMKEKERKEKEAREWTNQEEAERLRQKGAELMLAKPVREVYPTVESIKQTWSVGEQEKYLSLEAEAAALGKFIHEDGFLSEARIDLMKKIENPSSVRLNGADTIIHRYTPTVPLGEVNNMFNSLQARYRSVQAELNGMKKRIDDEIADRKAKIDSAYNAELRKYQALQHQFEDEMRLFEDERDMKRDELCKEVRNLKIVIPNRLREVYDKLTK